MPLSAYLVVRAVLGGLLVTVFALAGEVVKPKWFAGIFGASPAIALANLTLVVVVEGTGKAIADSRAMIGGAVALVVACVIGVVAVRRLRAYKGTAVMIATWIVVAVLAGQLVY
jgi:Protein of unknown function (DUF3147)